MTLSRLESSSFVEVPRSEIEPRFSDFESDVDRVGPHAILENCNVCYTILNSEKNDRKLSIKVYNLLLKCFGNLIHYVKDSLETNEFDLDQKDQNRKCIKTYCNLLCIPTQEKILVQKTILLPKGRKNKKTTSEESNFDATWLSFSEKYLDLLVTLFSFPVNHLWQPPIIEEDFIRTLINYVFKILEDVQLTKIKPVFRLISDLLGLIVSKHNAVLGVTLKFLNIVQHIENQGHNMASMIQTIVTKYNCGYIINQLFKEIGQTNFGDNSADVSSARNTSQFLSALGRLLPKEILNNSSLLMTHLELEPYSMRNGVLDCFGQIVIQLFKQPQLDDITRKSRDCFLDKIQEHTRDINAYVRSHVLQIWNEIVREKSIPLNRFNSIANLTINRLCDKSCNVRKNASSLLLTLLCNNPYSKSLNVKELERQLSKAQKCVSEPSNEAGIFINDAEAAWKEIEIGLRRYCSDYEPVLDNSQCSIDIDNIQPDDRRKIVESLREHQYFSCISLISNLLNISDSQVLTLYPFNELLTIFKNMYFEYLSCKMIQNGVLDDQPVVASQNEEEIEKMTVNYLNDALTFSKMVKSSMPIIFRLLQSETTTDVLEVIQLIVTSFKFEICQLDEVLDNISPLIWSNEASIKAAVLEACFEVLFFEPKGKSQIFVDNIFTLLKNSNIGFTSALEEVLSSLMEQNKISTQIIKDLWQLYTGSNSSDDQKCSAIRVLSLLTKGSPQIVGQNIELLAQVGFNSNASFKLAIFTCIALLNYHAAKNKGNESPGKLKLENNHIVFKKLISYLLTAFSDNASNLWSPLCEHVLKIIVCFSNKPFHFMDELLSKLLTGLLIECPDGHESTIDTVSLGRILNAVSHAAVSVLILLEGDFLTEIKKRSNVVHNVSNKKQRNSSISSKSLNEHNDDLLAGATADETEADFVKEVCENEILHENNIFSKFVPLIHHVIDKNASFPPELVSSASLALSKFMMISSDFCNKNLQILFTLLKKSPLEEVRANAAILIGDIIQRFPNNVEPWMSNVFSSLRDDSVTVRKVVLSILSSLILNDMVKVKGHISELALCIEDPDPIVSARTRLFFNELSRKDNAIYNILPDIISRLSEARANLNRDLFERVMKFLLKFLQKEKHCESLVEKLCNRFALSESLTEQMDIIFCFNQINLSEKPFRKLVENFPTFKDKVHDDQLYEEFVGLVAKFKKSAREEAKVMAEEFQQRIFDAHSRGITRESQAVVQKVVIDKVEKEDEDNSIPDQPIIIKSPKRSRRANKSIQTKMASPRLRKRNRRAKKVLTGSQDETDSDNPPCKNKL